MNILNKAKGILGMDEPDYNEEEGYEEEVDVEEEEDNSAGVYDAFAEPQKKTASRPMTGAPASSQMQVVLVKPEVFEEVDKIAGFLNNKRTVVLNLESADDKSARRILDFLAGVAYANGGNLSRSSEKTFIITPYNVDLSGKIDGEEENGSVFVF